MMRVGVIGVGRAGAIHLEAWRTLQDVEVVAVADRMTSVRRSATEAGLRVYGDPLDMIARERLDAVSICTPPVYHTQVAVACLERNLDVLCEKPLALTTVDALRMLRTAARVGRNLVLATKFRHVPAVIRARDLLAAGAIGEPVAFEIDFSSMVDMSQRWNCRRQVAGGGVVIDNGCHAFDIVAFLFGTVARVHATRLKQLQQISVEDSATLLVAAGQGLIGRIDVSWSLSTARETFVTIYGSGGTIEIGWRRSRLRRPGMPDEDIGASYDRGASHAAMVEAFRDVVVNRARPWITPGECLRTVAAVEAAYRSLRTGSWMRVDMLGMRDAREPVEARA